MIPMFAVHMPAGVDEAVLKTLHSGYITEGPRVKEFEQELIKYLRHPYVLTVNSCTSALQLALVLAGVKPGDTVISTPMTCTATNLAILNVGAKIFWADIDSLTGNVTGETLDSAAELCRVAKAIMVVDWGGRLVDLTGFRGWLTRAPIIEDAAHAFIPRQIIDNLFSCYSFQAIKHVTTGDGGALTVPNHVKYDRGKLLRWFGLDRDYKSDTGDNRVGQDIVWPGYKYHMNDIAATMGIVQMPYATDIVNMHRRNARQYTEQLDRNYFTFPEYTDDHAYWLFTVLCPNEEERQSFMHFMKSKGIDVSQVHGRCDTLTAFEPFSRWKLSGVDSFSSRQVSIPVHWKLSESDRNQIISRCNKWARGL